MASERTANCIRRIIAIAALAAVAAPAAADRSSFPLSTYPIYAHARPRSLTINVVSVIGLDGTRRAAGLDAIARTDDPLIAQSTIDRAVRDDATAGLCAAIARRLGSDSHAVEISIDRYDLVDRLQLEAAPRERDIVARCEASP